MSGISSRGKNSEANKCRDANANLMIDARAPTRDTTSEGFNTLSNNGSNYSFYLYKQIPLIIAQVLSQLVFPNPVSGLGIASPQTANHKSTVDGENCARNGTERRTRQINLLTPDESVHDGRSAEAKIETAAKHTPAAAINRIKEPALHRIYATRQAGNLAPNRVAVEGAFLGAPMQLRHGFFEGRFGRRLVTARDGFFKLAKVTAGTAAACAIANAAALTLSDSLFSGSAVGHFKFRSSHVSSGAGYNAAARDRQGRNPLKPRFPRDSRVLGVNMPWRGKIPQFSHLAMLEVGGTFFGECGHTFLLIFCGEG